MEDFSEAMKTEIHKPFSNVDNLLKDSYSCG